MKQVENNLQVFYNFTGSRGSYTVPLKRPPKNNPSIPSYQKSQCRQIPLPSPERVIYVTGYSPALCEVQPLYPVCPYIPKNP